MILFSFLVITLVICIIHQRHRIPFNVRGSWGLAIMLFVLALFIPLVIPFILLGYYLGHKNTWIKK